MEIDNVLVQETDATGGDRFPDSMHLARSMQTVEGVTVALMDI